MNYSLKPVILRKRRWVQMLAWNGCNNEGKWQLGLIQSPQVFGGKETRPTSLHHVLYWRRVGQPISLLQGPPSQHYDIVNWMFLCCGDCPGNCRMVSSIQDPYPLTTSGTLPPSGNSHKHLQTLPNVPWGGNTVPVWEPLPWVFISSPLASLVSWALDTMVI